MGSRRAPDPDDEKPVSVGNVADPTQELQTSDLKELAVDGLVQPRTVNAELRDIGPAETIIVDFGEDRRPPSPVVRKRVATRPRHTPSIADADADTLPVGRPWIVVIVYCAAIAALGLSIYWRFFN